jgi:hypothetical protein
LLLQARIRSSLRPSRHLVNNPFTHHYIFNVSSGYSCQACIKYCG